MAELKSIIRLFAIEGEVVEINPLGNGLINDTYKVTTAGDAPDYVLQRINNAIFTDYINGDTYYKIAYPQHNLVRTRNQLTLFRSALSKVPEMNKFISSL